MHNGFNRRKLLRLKDYDYSQAGYYFVTICVQDRKEVLGKIVGNDALVVPSPIGEKVIDCWNNISKFNENVETDIFCLMPNHIHGIIIIENDNEDVEFEKKYGFETAERRGRRSLQGIIKDFKSITTRYYNSLVDDSLKNTLWQKSYYERVIRDDKELQGLREYIYNNPLQWELDEYY